jgi:hypothetical protein
MDKLPTFHIDVPDGVEKDELIRRLVQSESTAEAREVAEKAQRFWYRGPVRPSTNFSNHLVLDKEEQDGK